MLCLNQIKEKALLIPLIMDAPGWSSWFPQWRLSLPQRLFTTHLRAGIIEAIFRASLLLSTLLAPPSSDHQSLLHVKALPKPQTGSVRHSTPTFLTFSMLCHLTESGDEML